MMIPELKQFHSPDVDDLKHYKPVDGQSVEFKQYRLQQAAKKPGGQKGRIGTTLKKVDEPEFKKQE